ncbi:MAG TPA: flagellar hook-associated protein FlgL [Solirubrobacteraceae bacterium]|jgi:flagellar hook-associated protein 3 FlgL|nr:flagellar hook-associated protein FlgL [Solirubrobacteraceae bacterium]
MIGRITPLMTTAQVLSNINSLQDQMDTTEEQLSTGKTINQPSDNPYGASLAVQLNTDLSGLNDYTNNITDGTAWTSSANTALDNIQSMVQRVQSLVTEAASGGESASDLSSIGAEVTQLTQSIKQAANTQYNGQYIFSGTATTTAPYSDSTGDVYQGNTGTVMREIGPNTALQVNANISSLLGSGSSADDGKLLDTLDQITSDLNGGTSADVADLSNNQLNNLSSNLNTLEGLQANVGAAQDRLTQASSTIQSLQTSDTAALSNDEDANVAATYTTYSNEQAAFSAALRAGASIVQSSLMDFLSN